MAKQKKNVSKNKPVDQPPKTEQLVDRYSRILQLLALASVVVLLILGGLVPTIDTPSYVIIGLLGLAVGLSPEQIGKMVTDVVKAFIGKK